MLVNKSTSFFKMFKHYELRTGESLYISLITDIANLPEIKKQLLNQTLKCCCINPTLIVDTFQIAIAADKACLANSRNKLVTKNIYTEILYNISTSKNITSSLIKFGIQENNKNLIVASVGPIENLKEELSKIQGNQIALDKLEELMDKKEIKKEYNILDEELKESSLIDSVISRIATKNV